MKKWIFLTLLSLSLSGFTQMGDGALPVSPEIAFHPGEKLTYRVHYGFINAGEAVMEIHDKIQMVNDRPCYKINVEGKSTGMFDYMLRIRDTWGTYLDTTALLPHRFYRYVEEGKYRKYEITDFNRQKDSVIVKNLDKKNKKDVRKVQYFPIPENAHDMVSGYYYLRTLDYSKIKPGTIIELDGFFENTSYNFPVRFMGKEMVNTDLGKLNALVLQPIMPENSLFSGEDAIKVYISDDTNKIPLKVKAEMFVGAVEIDITSYKVKGRSVNRR
ncbi:DUF3108 domain-containing protein [Cytophagales bacterium LB-30]|uniref:DUF3108 domain-containing protein n=1 Tax=Shiella aurantiaca TaxID=3058365 RepID=A0ABT8F705_9BACT|nr:DUF3108 domain-containing protein [Shiella aurantiaca]MDN4166252.1 DUF3108 domain-containing protein [Shiella aurantiaca]